MSTTRDEEFTGGELRELLLPPLDDDGLLFEDGDVLTESFAEHDDLDTTTDEQVLDFITNLEEESATQDSDDVSDAGEQIWVTESLPNLGAERGLVLESDEGDSRVGSVEESDIDFTDQTLEADQGEEGAADLISSASLPLPDLLVGEEDDAEPPLTLPDTRLTCRWGDRSYWARVHEDTGEVSLWLRLDAELYLLFRAEGVGPVRLALESDPARLVLLDRDGLLLHVQPLEPTPPERETSQ